MVDSIRSDPHGKRLPAGRTVAERCRFGYLSAGAGRFLRTFPPGQVPLPMDASFLVNTLLILGLALAVVLGGLAIRFARRQAMEEDRPTRPEDVLGPLEEAYRRGELDEAEYQRVRRSVERGPAHPPDPRPHPAPSPPPDEPAPGVEA
jgi:hypothetical protein